MDKLPSKRLPKKIKYKKLPFYHPHPADSYTGAYGRHKKAANGKKIPVGTHYLEMPFGWELEIVNYNEKGKRNGWSAYYNGGFRKTATLYENGIKKKKLRFAKFSKQVSPTLECNYALSPKDGKRKLHGRMVERFNQGKLSFECSFRYGELHGRLNLYNLGELRESARFNKGLLHGNYFIYKDGKISIRQTYKYGNRLGWTYYFDENGQAEARAFFDKRGRILTCQNRINVFQREVELTEGQGPYLRAFTTWLSKDNLNAFGILTRACPDDPMRPYDSVPEEIKAAKDHATSYFIE